MEQRQKDLARAPGDACAAETLVPTPHTWRRLARSTLQGKEGSPRRKLLSKYNMGEDNKIACERIRGERCNTTIVMFGEHVWYLPLKAMETHHGKGEEKVHPGV